MKRFFITITLVAISTTCFTQDNAEQSFHEYRKSLLKNYESFRQSVLDNYADYLNSVWQEFRAFKGENRDDVPKPVTPPDTDTQPAVVPQEDAPAIVPVKESPLPEQQPVKPSVPIAPSPVVPAPQSTSFSFYGVTIKSPVLTPSGIRNIEPSIIADAWERYEQQHLDETARVLSANAGVLGLNDWFTFEMVCKCVGSQLKHATSVDRITMIHYLLVNMDFNVRLASYNNSPCILFAVEQMVYARPYLTIDGRKYYIYNDDNKAVGENAPIYTYNLPQDAWLGRPLDMRISNPMNLKGSKSRRCDLSYQGITLSADIDVSTMEMLRYYPQVSIPVYAMSRIDNSLRQSILRQLLPYFKDKPKPVAVNMLLHFVQHAFEYATDDAQHGYEKPYFFEENFFYPRNDCEDRSVFFAWLVRNLLDLDIHLIHYPGHECTAIHFPDNDVKGTGYIYMGKKFVICDPTYIGADIGECMPDFVNVTPEVELWY